MNHIQSIRNMKTPSGFSPKSLQLRQILRNSITQREPCETIIVHHITDFATHLQYEIERRSKLLGIKFERVIIK